jgi:hypothetical protein
MLSPQTFLFWIDYLQCVSRKFFMCFGVDMLAFPEPPLLRIIRKSKKWDRNILKTLF